MTRIRLFLFYACMAVLCIFKPSEGMRMAEDAGVGASLRSWRAPPQRTWHGTVWIGFAGGLVVIGLWLWALATVAAWAVA